MYNIRKFNFSTSDYEAVVAVHNADWPDEPDTVENWKFSDDNRDKKFLHQRFVVETPPASGDRPQIVAEGDVWESAWSYVPGKYGLGFSIHPEYANQGIEEQFYNHLVAYLGRRELKPKILDTYTREDRRARVNFFEERGFKVIMRENESALDVTDYDFSRFNGAFEKVTANGIEIATLPKLQERYPDWMQRMYDLIIPIEHDIPSPDDITPQPLEEFAKGFKSPNFLPDAHFIALDGDEWVGISTLWKDAVKKERLWVGITGVLRSHRRKGIATALKLKTFQYAIDRGVVTLQTGNEEKNPMYDLNIKLGFKPLPAWVDLRKKIEDE